MRLWGIAAPEADPRELDDQAGATTALAFSADGRWLAAGGEGWHGRGVGPFRPVPRRTGTYPATTT